MLEQIDLTKKLSKKDLKAEIKDIQNQLFSLQSKLTEDKIPMIIVFEGWQGAGRGTVIEHVVSRLDPRGFKVYRIHEPSLEESYHPFLWRFWTKTPAQGRIALFYQSWYRRVLLDRMEGQIKRSKLELAFEDILSFERLLADDGVIIIKFFLHISKKEQKKRFKAMEKDKFLSWKVTKADIKRQEKYDLHVKYVEEMLAKTSTSYAPWTIVEANDLNWAQMKVYKTILEAGANGIERKKRAVAARKAEMENKPAVAPKHLHPTILDKVDLSLKLPEKKYRNDLEKYSTRFRELEFELYKHRIPMVVVYEGWDAGGKGGNIKRLISRLDPRGYEVVPIAAPSAEEKAHNHLWRFWNQIPKAGHITIFDRSWYGRVLVERVEGFASETEWRRAYQEIREFEAHLANYGTVIVKFWIHLSQDEQLRRFKEREQDKFKQYKLTDEDWRNREKWGVYEEAVLDMLENTSTLYAPWTIVEGEDKYYGRIRTLKTACEAVERRLDGIKKK